MKILKENRVIDRNAILFFCGGFAFLYFLNAIFPTQSDDLGCRIGGLSAAISSYNNWNGRLGELLRVAFGSYFATTVWYAPINAFIGATVILLLFIIVFARAPKFTLKDCSVFLILIAFLLVDYGFCFGSFFYWAAGSFNHLLAWFFILLWSLPYRFYWQNIFAHNSRQDERRGLKAVFLLVVGFCAGWSTEFGIVFVFLQICFVLYAYIIRRQSLPLWYFIGIISVMSGWLLVYLSPGVVSRIQAIVSGGGEYRSLSEIVHMPPLILIKTIIHTYDKPFRAHPIYYENYILLSLFLLLSAFLSGLNAKKKIITLSVVISLGIVVFLVSKLLFLLCSMFIACMYAREFRKRNDRLFRLFVIITCVFFAEFVFIGSTIQTNIPRRASFHYAVLNFILIAIIMDYCFDMFAGMPKVRLAACICCTIFTFCIVSLAGAECYRMRLKWNAMEKSIEEQKSAGIKHIVVDKETFVSKWRNYSDWSNPDDKEIDDWPNSAYAKVYGVETFTAK